MTLQTTRVGTAQIVVIALCVGIAMTAGGTAIAVLKAGLVQDD